MARRIAGSLYLPGGEREDLAQEARVGILGAIRAWDPGRSVPFRCFAWLCGLREANTAVNAARAAKHRHQRASSRRCSRLRLVRSERPTRLAGHDRFHGKQQRSGRSASSVRTAQLHGMR